jgi:hypothetical protein
MPGCSNKQVCVTTYGFALLHQRSYIPQMRNDTLPDAHAIQLQVYRKMSGELRLRELFAMSEDARSITLAGLRARFPAASELEILQMERRFRLGQALADAAWPAKRTG